MLKDYEIAKSVKLDNIKNIAKKINIDEKHLYCYGDNKAKISLDIIKENSDSNIVLVTAMSPTPLGEGKTTISIGLSDAMQKLNKKVCLCLREPSLGPVFGLKGGAAGGGYSQVAPMDEINLHFTGDIHAITTANNLISSVIDNHIFQGNELNIDKNKIIWKRSLDINDRQLRYIMTGINDEKTKHEDGFIISVASEIMAVLCLATSYVDLRERLSNIVVAYNTKGQFVYVKDLNIVGSLLAILKDAFKPNLVQTLEKTPTLIHGGPFANIAHGCNSIIATNMAQSLAEIVVTEAGFGADLGMEKFLDIKCRALKTHPKVVVVVATIKALKYHGGVDINDIKNENVAAVKKGFENLKRHLDNIKNVFHLTPVVALNHFEMDKDIEIETLKKLCDNENVDICIVDSFMKGGSGALDLAQCVLNHINDKNDFTYVYDTSMHIKEKIKNIVAKMYRGKDVEYSKEAEEMIEKLEQENLYKFPICIAKTQYSFSDDKNLLGAPTDFTFHINEIKPMLGAKFIVAIAGNIMTMPGLPKVPNAYNIDVDSEGNTIGIF